MVSSTKFIEGKKLYKKIFVNLIFFCLFCIISKNEELKSTFHFVIFVDTADGRTRTLIES